MTVAQYIFDFLSNKGIDMAFMVSGSSAMWLVDALARETRYKVVCNHHEQACAMSAEVYARTTGKMAVTLVTVGPGATNAITGIAGAFTDSAPMFVVSGQVSSKTVQYAKESGLRQIGTQSLLLDKMAEPITKYFSVVMEASDIRYEMEKAFYLATHGRPGPVWLDIPVDIQNKQVPDTMRGFVPDEEAAPAPDSLELLGSWLKATRRPLILAGHGIRVASAGAALLRFAEEMQIPIVTTRLGIDLCETNHPLYVGRPGAYGDRPSHYAIQNCDLLLCIGSRLAVSNVGYDGSGYAPNAKKILVDIDPLETRKDQIPLDLLFTMDAGEFLDKLTITIEDKPDTAEWLGQCRKWREKYRVVLPEYSAEKPLNSYYVMERLTQKAKEHDIVVVDTGTSCNVASQTWDLKKGQRYIISGGISAMGYWAGAIGACVACPKGSVLALTGDGSFQMNVQELATIAYHKLPIKLFVFSNGGYLLIRLNQHNYMNDRFLGVGPDSGVGMPDICRVAQAYGIKAVRIETAEELDDKLEDVYNAKEPVVCEIVTNPFQEMSPRMASRVMPDGSLKASAYEDLCPFLPDEEHKENMISR